MHDPRLQSEASLERANDPLDLMRARRDKIRFSRMLFERLPQVQELFRQAQVAEQAARVVSSEQVSITPEPEVWVEEPQAAEVVPIQSGHADEARARIAAIHEEGYYDQEAA